MALKHEFNHICPFPCCNCFEEIKINLSTEFKVSVIRLFEKHIKFKLTVLVYKQFLSNS